eukprot:5041032-Prymnesium_polylepis.1
MLLHAEETIGELAGRLGGGHLTAGGVRLNADARVQDVEGELHHQPLRVQIWLRGPATHDSVSHDVSLDEPVGALLSRLEPEPGALKVLRGSGPPLDRACSWAAQG